MKKEQERTRRGFLFATLGGAGMVLISPKIVGARDTDAGYESGGFLDEPMQEEVEVIQVQTEEVVSEGPITREIYVAETPQEIEAAAREAARSEGIDENKFVRVMDCESRRDPLAVNKQGSGASGLFQFMPSTWSNVINKFMKRSGMDVFNARDNIEAAARLWKVDGSHHWRQCGG